MKKLPKEEFTPSPQITTTYKTTPMIPFSNSYANLPERFYELSDPTPAPNPSLIEINDELAKEFNIDPSMLRSDEGIAILSGQKIHELSTPLAQAYAGHQFGGFSPQLGDGRAVLLGEIANQNQELKDLQLKGSGRTPFSRNGDGKSALGPVIREYLMSEAMHALGVPSTRALAAIRSGENVIRETPLPGGVFTRIAASHLRIGTFQYFAARRDIEALEILTDFALNRHFPTADIHGVMNTDNCSISGETIDYGPCAFMDDFHPACVYSAIDRDSRYAWGNQAPISHWNLTRLAEALLPIIDLDNEQANQMAENALEQFSSQFVAHYNSIYKSKFALQAETDINFIQESLSLLADQQVDYTLFFRNLTALANNKRNESSITDLFVDSQAAEKWLQVWKQHLDKNKISNMSSINPILIPRNHQVEAAIQLAYKGDYSHFQRLNEAWKQPFTENQQYQELESPPLSEEKVNQTFCGT